MIFLRKHVMLAQVQALADRPGTARDEVLATFYERAKANKEALVINKWFAVQARPSHKWPVAS